MDKTEEDQINQQRVVEYLATLRKMRILLMTHFPLIKKLERIYGNR